MYCNNIKQYNQEEEPLGNLLDVLYTVHIKCYNY